MFVNLHGCVTLVILLAFVSYQNAQEYRYPKVSRKEFDCEPVFDDTGSITAAYFPSPYSCHEYYICEKGHSYIPKKVTCGPLIEDPSELGVYFDAGGGFLACGQAWRADPNSTCFKPSNP